MFQQRSKGTIRQKGVFDGGGGKIAIGCDRQKLAIGIQKMNEYTENRITPNLQSFSLSFSLPFPPFLSYFPFFLQKGL